jgi:hypothetical protein
MRDINFRTSVQNIDVGDDIEDAIRDGIRNAVRGSLPESMELVARLKIIEEDAIWRENLINSFENVQMRRGDNYVLIFQNTAEYAAPVNDGSEYGSEGPPLEALIPWVRTHLYYWEAPGDNDGTGIAIMTDGSGIDGPPDPPYTRSIDIDRTVENIETNFLPEDGDAGGVNQETFTKIDYAGGGSAFAKLPGTGRLSSDYDAVRNEVMFTRMQGTMDWELGPEARWGSVTIDGETEEGLFQAYVDDGIRVKTALQQGDITRRELLTDYQDKVAKAFLFHLLLDNTDFHGNNVLIDDDGTLHFIDNGGDRLTGNAFDLRGIPIGSESLFLGDDDEDYKEELNDLLDREIELADQLGESAIDILENFYDVQGEDHYLVDRADFLLANQAEELKKYIENYREQMNNKIDGTSDDLVPRISELSGETSVQDTNLQQMKEEGGIAGDIVGEFEDLGEDQTDKDELDDVSDKFLP